MLSSVSENTECPDVKGSRDVPCLLDVQSRGTNWFQLYYHKHSLRLSTERRQGFYLLVGSILVKEIIEELTNTRANIPGYANHKLLTSRDKNEDTLCDRIRLELRITST